MDEKRRYYEILPMNKGTKQIITNGGFVDKGVFYVKPIKGELFTKIKKTLDEMSFKKQGVTLIKEEETLILKVGIYTSRWCNNDYTIQIDISYLPLLEEEKCVVHITRNIILINKSVNEINNNVVELISKYDTIEKILSKYYFFGRVFNKHKHMLENNKKYSLSVTPYFQSKIKLIKENIIIKP